MGKHHEAEHEADAMDTLFSTEDAIEEREETLGLLGILPAVHLGFSHLLGDALELCLEDLGDLNECFVEHWLKDPLTLLRMLEIFESDFFLRSELSLALGALFL